VSTFVAADQLACFRDAQGLGSVIKNPAGLPPSDVAVVGNAVYAAYAFGITVYRLPIACR
jgi:hypothetical protein